MGDHKLSTGVTWRCLSTHEGWVKRLELRSEDGQQGDAVSQTEQYTAWCLKYDLILNLRRRQLQPSFCWGYLLCGLSILKAREHVAVRSRQGVEENKQKAGKGSVLSAGHRLSWEIDSGIIDSAIWHRSLAWPWFLRSSYLSLFTDWERPPYFQTIGPLSL